MTSHGSSLLDANGAFCKHGGTPRPGAPVGPLVGLSFAAKDLFDVEGETCCAGTPDWLSTHAPATRTAAAIQLLLDAGASLTGKTLTDELALSLTGENAHYGTPENVRAPGCVPGGSSSGSASAVAAGLVDFALGTDTGGSVRVPASYNGLVGFRPTHGRVPVEGLIALAPRFDTVGWFARDGGLAARIGACLLPETPTRQAPITRLLLLKDSLALLDEEARAPFLRAVESSLAHLVASGEGIPACTLAPGDLEPLGRWPGTYLPLQAADIAVTHGAWLDRTRPRLGKLIADRMAQALATPPSLVAAAAGHVIRLRAALDEAVPPGSALVLPSAPGAAHARGLSDAEVNAVTIRGLALAAPASLGGLPQISLPLAALPDGRPLGVSLIGARGQDASLLALGERLVPSPQLSDVVRQGGSFVAHS